MQKEYSNPEADFVFYNRRGFVDFPKKGPTVQTFRIGEGSPATYYEETPWSRYYTIKDRFGDYVIFSIPAQVYRLCDNPRYYQPVEYMVARAVGGGMSDINDAKGLPMTDWTEYKVIKLFQHYPYTANMSGPERLRAARDYARMCNANGEVVARAHYYSYVDPHRDTRRDPEEEYRKTMAVGIRELELKALKAAQQEEARISI